MAKASSGINRREALVSLGLAALGGAASSAPAGVVSGIALGRKSLEQRVGYLEYGQRFAENLVVIYSFLNSLYAEELPR